jgi:pyruvate dehydrogenase E1 component beta subunit
MQRDPRVFLMGEDVGHYGGCYAVSRGLLEELGSDRIRDTPLSESGFTGAGIGAAIGGMRPIVEIMTVNFSLLALDQIVNNAATLRHMSGGQIAIPLVIRMATGAGRQLAAQHSHSLEAWYAHVPGLKVLAPATIEDARFMLAPALRDPNPVVIFEHVGLYNISAEVIDLRVLRPLDDATILASVRKTRRAVIVDEGWRSGSLAAEVGMRIVEGAFYDLDAPIARVCSAEAPIPYAQHLEAAALPQVPAIVRAAKEAMGSRALGTSSRARAFDGVRSSSTSRRPRA